MLSSILSSHWPNHVRRRRRRRRRLRRDTKEKKKKKKDKSILFEWMGKAHDKFRKTAPYARSSDVGRAKSSLRACVRECV